MINHAPEPSGRAAFEAFWRSLLVAKWQDSEGPLRLSSSLCPSDLASSSFFQNARVFLTALAESGGTVATATGNLNRVFVRQMFDRISLNPLTRESLLRVCKVLNERDVWSLHIVRIVSECAGLVSRRKKRFQVTRVGHGLLSDAQSGALFRKLFLAYFRKFDLHYDFHLRDVPGIQETMAVILWRLDTVARDWVPVRGLVPQLLLPGVHTPLRPAMVPSSDTEEWILAGYVLKPLFDLGLIEKQKTSEWPAIDDKDSVRVTALWQKFLSFGRIA